jgi:hypothetical protein
VHHRACNCAHRRPIIGAGPDALQLVTQAPLTTPLPGKSEVRPVALAEYPSSGILPAPPPAPVAVPPSGVLQPAPERRTVTTIPVKIAPPPRSAETPAAPSANRHLRRIARGAESLKRGHLSGITLPPRRTVPLFLSDPPDTSSSGFQCIPTPEPVRCADRVHTAGYYKVLNWRIGLCVGKHIDP